MNESVINVNIILSSISSALSIIDNHNYMIFTYANISSIYWSDTLGQEEKGQNLSIVQVAESFNKLSW